MARLEEAKAKLAARREAASDSWKAFSESTTSSPQDLAASVPVTGIRYDGDHPVAAPSSIPGGFANLFKKR